LNFGKTNFVSAHFDNTVNFRLASFGAKADFSDARFDSAANFKHARFEDEADFSGTQFNNMADFGGAQFKGEADFSGAQFDSSANFDFFGHFAGVANFESAKFNRRVGFDDTGFTNGANFRHTKFNGEGSFYFTIFHGEVDFRNVQFDNLRLTRAKIKGKLMPGSNDGQKFDFTRAIFSPEARLELHELVELKIQPEKLKYILLENELGYFLKKDIIENLKSKSFPNDNGAQFEPDYIFAKSTIYQAQADEYTENRWHEISKWPKWIGNTLYYWTMGLGYRPFRLIWWALGIVIIYTGIFMKKMRERVNEYITGNFETKQRSTNENGEKPPPGFWESLLNCAYFSVMLFFTFRLKGNILTFFNGREKRLVVSEWLLGFFVYVAFLTLSKAGSILHNPKELFVG